MALSSLYPFLLLASLSSYETSGAELELLRMTPAQERLLPSHQLREVSLPLAGQAVSTRFRQPHSLFL